MIYLLVIMFCFIIAVLVTPYVMKLAYFTKAVDQPNQRKSIIGLCENGRIGDLCFLFTRIYDI